MAPAQFAEEIQVGVMHARLSSKFSDDQPQIGDRIGGFLKCGVQGYSLLLGDKCCAHFSPELLVIE